MPPRTTIQRLSAVAVAAAGALVAGVLAAPPAYAADVTNTIAQVQGTNVATSPLVGQTVTVEGVVTGDHRVGGYNGIYIQTAGSGGATDATPNASDGIFVALAGGAGGNVAIGHRVKVTGAPIPFGGMKASGLGREGGFEGFEPFVETKYFCLGNLGLPIAAVA